MAIFRLPSVSLLLLLPPLLYCLPVAEDRHQVERSVERHQEAPSIADRSQETQSDILHGRSGRQLPSFESGQEGSASSLAHALRVAPTSSEAGTEQKRDDIRKYDKPQPWSYEDYRGVYLAGLARIAREGGGRKNKQRRSLTEMKLDTLKSDPNFVGKRDSGDKYERPRPPPDHIEQNQSNLQTDAWGLTLDDYHRFLSHNLDANWQHWTTARWNNFARRYHEFQASGGQVGFGDKRKRDNAWDQRAEDVYDHDSKLMRRNWDDLEEPTLEKEVIKRDSLENYKETMYDEDGWGGEDHAADTAIWDELMREAYGPRKRRSLETNHVLEDPSVSQEEVTAQVSDPVLTPTSSAEAGLYDEQRKVNRDEREKSFGKSDEARGKEYSIFREVSLLRDRMLNRKILSMCEELPPVPPVPLAGETSNPVVSDEYDDEFRGGPQGAMFQEPGPRGQQQLIQNERRDSILNYADTLSDSEWVRLMRVGAVRPFIRVPGENMNPKLKRDAVSSYRSHYNLESLSTADLNELYSIAMKDPAFLAFQEQHSVSSIIGGKKQKRSPMPPDVHQTAPVHRGAAGGGTENVAQGSQSVTSNTTSGDKGSSSGDQTTESNVKSQQKREVAGKYDAESQNNSPTSIEEQSHRPSSRGPISPHHSFKAETIAEVLAAEDAEDLANDASIAEKRDSMLLYAGGLDDWDDCVLSRMFSDTDCEEGLNYPRNRRKRDSSDDYESSDANWDSYGDLLKAMEEGRLPSYLPASRKHPRALSNFPSWTPGTDPKPPGSDRRGLSNFPSWSPGTDPKPPGDRRGLSNFPSWTPGTNPKPPGSDRRGLSNFSSWNPGTDPKPPASDRRDMSTKTERDSSDELTNFPPWEPSTNPNPPEKSREADLMKEQGRDRSDQNLVGGYVDNKGKSIYSSQDSSVLLSKIHNPPSNDPSRLQLQAVSKDENSNGGDHDQRSRPEKRDKTDQYADVMTDEDEWVDIYRLFALEVAAERARYPDGKARRQRRTPEPDTVIIRPARNESGQQSYDTTIKDGNTPTSTGLVSMIGNVPGPGTKPFATVTTPYASPPPDPSAIFFPFGTLLAVVPHEPAATANHKRMENELDRRQEDSSNDGPVKKRAPNPSSTATPKTIHFSQTAPQIPSQTPPKNVTLPPILNSTLSNVIAEFGPLLALASALPPNLQVLPSATLPAAGTTFNTAQPVNPKRDSTGNYPSPADSVSVHDWDDGDWEVLDNFITFQDAEGPLREKRQQTTTTPDPEDLPIAPVTDTPTPTTTTLAPPPALNLAPQGYYTGPLDCLFFNADANLRVPAGCFCRGDATALPTLSGANPCDYSSLPTVPASVAGARVRARAGVAGGEKRDEEHKYDSDDAEEEAIRAWVLAGGARGRGERVRRDNGVEVVSGAGEQGVQEEYQREEKVQHAEGVQQGQMEQNGGRVKRGEEWMWVPEEEELGEGLPEGAAGEGDGGFKARAVVEERHCGRAVLPEGYGDQGSVVDHCGDGGER